MKTQVLYDHHMPETVCPACGSLNDGALGMTGIEAPKPGDLSVCIRCASALIFDTEFKLHVMTEENIAALHPEERRQLRRSMFIANQAIQDVQGRGKPQ